MEKKITKKNDFTEFSIYKASEGDIKIEAFLQDENIWLPQKKIATLFDVSKTTISEHLTNIFKNNELDKASVVRKFRTTAEDGKNYDVKFYNLDAILAVGYRVSSYKATQFRIWASKILKEFIIKGFSIDDERMKNGQYFEKDYFQELLERVRSIRTSERRIYQKITDIFAECAIDYDKNSEVTKNFYAMIQNKFHFAITGKTAAEMIYQKVDKNKKFIGLKTWKNSPKGKIIKSDMSIAKNYLKEKEIRKLEKTISGYFDYIEILIENHKELKMKDLQDSIDNFLNFNEYKILKGKGKISHKKAEKKAFSEYDKFNKKQKIESDFDKQVKKVLKNKNG